MPEKGMVPSLPVNPDNIETFIPNPAAGVPFPVLYSTRNCLCSLPLGDAGKGRFLERGLACRKSNRSVRACEPGCAGSREKKSAEGFMFPSLQHGQSLAENGRIAGAAAIGASRGGVRNAQNNGSSPFRDRTVSMPPAPPLQPALLAEKLAASVFDGQRKSALFFLYGLLW